jgi:hypothetical protein
LSAIVRHGMLDVAGGGAAETAPEAMKQRVSGRVWPRGGDVEHFPPKRCRVVGDGGGADRGRERAPAVRCRIRDSEISCTGCGTSGRLLETRRAWLFERLAAIGDFRWGSICENYRRRGKANGGCAQRGHPGHGPWYLWTRTMAGWGTRGRRPGAAVRSLAAGEGLDAAEPAIRTVVIELGRPVPEPLLAADARLEQFWRQPHNPTPAADLTRQAS